MTAAHRKGSPSPESGATGTFSKKVRPQGKNNSDPSLVEVQAAVKNHLLAGRCIRLIDYPDDTRPLLIGAIATLRDELPIKAGWTTVRESHLSETRLRARVYRIDSTFLRGEDVV